MAVSAARANMIKKAHIRAINRKIPYELEHWQKRIDNETQGEKKARAQKLLDIICECVGVASGCKNPNFIGKSDKHQKGFLRKKKSPFSFLHKPEARKPR